jgi:hypothetical protein
MHLPARCLAALTLIVFAGTAAAKGYSWTKTDEVGSDPVSKTTKDEYDFSATGRVEARDIGGNVEVKTGDGSRVAFIYERRAATQQDMDCETLRVEHSKDELRIWLEHKRERACRVVRADDKLVLTVPRGASVELESIGDSVNVTGVEGLVRLSSIGDTATLTDVQQVRADSIGDSIKMNVSKLGPAGIELDSIGDSVELNLPEKIDARLRIGSVGDQIRASGLHMDDDDDDYGGVLGKGGPMISIESVGDDVVIRGPRVSSRSPE